jgi:phosphoenolpyruvate---glycerone phosphotransferase subunit DhaL
MSALTVEVLRNGFTRIVGNLENSAEELNSLDAVLGDGDLGVSLVRGGRSLLAELPNLPAENLGAALGRCAQAITKISGSTCGTLFAAGLLRAAKQVEGRSEVPWSEMSSLLQAAIEGMARRGKCELGDKTIIDALEASRSAMVGLDDPDRIICAANTAVADAVVKFKARPSRQGRARMFPDRSIGSADPGMVAFQRILEALQ